MWSPQSLEEPGKEAQLALPWQVLAGNRAVAIISGPCLLPRTGTGTASGVGVAGGASRVNGAALPVGVEGPPDSSSDSCSSPDSHISQATDLPQPAVDTVVWQIIPISVCLEGITQTMAG